MNSDLRSFPHHEILEATRTYPTPFFLYSEARLRENCRRFREAFRKHFHDFQPLFAIKANPNPHLLKIIQEEGFGFDASSGSEAWITQKLSGTGMFTGNYTPEQELRLAQEAGLILNLDDISLIPLLQKVGIPETLSFRVNPGMGKSSMKSNVLAGPDAKFGVPFEKAPEAYLQAKALGVKRFGIHMMTGSNVLDEDYFPLVTKKLLSIRADIHRKTGIEIEFMNIGGGFGVPYRPEEKPLNLDRIARAIRNVLTQQSRRDGLKEPQLWAEPGRIISANAGWLVGRVQVIKKSYKTFVGIDASSNDMPRPSIYGAYHHVSVLNHSKTKQRVSVVGMICENNDQFAQDRLLPKCAIGDVVVIHHCGAHAYSMGHQYNGRPRHAEILLQANGELLPIRRAETFDDLFQTVTPF